MDAAVGVSERESFRKECQRVRVKLGKLARPSTVAGGSLTACLVSPEPWREVGDGTDRRDPPISDRV